MDNKSYAIALSEILDINETEVVKDYNSLKEHVSHPDFLLKLIHETKENFNKHMQEANEKFGTDRKVFIEGNLYLIELLLKNNLPDNQIVQDKIENNREQLKEQYEYWREELIRLPDSNNRTKELDVVFKTKEISRKIKYVNDNLADFMLAIGLKIKSDNHHETKKILIKEHKIMLKDALSIFDNIRPELPKHQEQNILKSIDFYKNEIENQLIKGDVIFLDQLMKEFDLEINTEKLNEHTNSISDDVEKLKFDSNMFNKKGFELFKYLIDNYVITGKERGLQKRFSNVWHFMKNDNSKKDIYKLFFTQNEYIKYVKNHFKFKITNKDKSSQKYEQVDLFQLNEHVSNFEEML